MRQAVLTVRGRQRPSRPARPNRFVAGRGGGGRHLLPVRCLRLEPPFWKRGGAAILEAGTAPLRCRLAADPESAVFHPKFSLKAISPASISSAEQTSPAIARKKIRKRWKTFTNGGVTPSTRLTVLPRRTERCGGQCGPFRREFGLKGTKSSSSIAVMDAFRTEKAAG